MAKDQEWTRLVGGPKDGTCTKQLPKDGKIVIQEAGFTGSQHIYKISSIFDNDGDKVGYFEGQDSNEGEK